MIKLITVLLASIFLVTGCTQKMAEGEPEPSNTFSNRAKPAEIVALQYVGYSEKTHRKELKELIGVDPRRTEWCAAFVNGILSESGIDGTNSYLARSFLGWGRKISKKDIQAGDVVIFPRGKDRTKGHVGFYMRTQKIDGVTYYYILGGNQNNKVSVVLYPANYAIGIRRYIPI